ncbi:MAG: ABC transporter substrate-binding protein [Pseudomonadota bacterium]
MFCSLAASALAQQKLTFREPVAGPTAEFVTQVLREAYADLGIELEFQPLPRLRAERLASQGEIAGEMGRLEGLDEHIPNLNRVPFKLYEFSIVLIGDQRKCGICTLDKVNNLAYVSGMRAAEKVIESQNFDKPLFQQTATEQVAKLLASGRIDAALLGDFELRNLTLDAADEFVVYRMRHETGYHFLHDDYKHLVEPLYNKLQAMENSGRIAELRRQHNLTLPDKLQPIELPNTLTAVSAIQPDLTNTDGSGKLWHVVRSVFSDVSDQIRVAATNWPRAHNSVTEKRAHMLVGVREEQFKQSIIYSQTPIGTDDALYLFATDARLRDQLLSGSDALTVCLSGDDYQAKLLPGRRTYYRANTPLDCFAMLDLGRVHGVIDYQDNLPDWIDSPYAEARLTDPVPLFVGFPDSQLGRLLKRHFDHSKKP